MPTCKNLSIDEFVPFALSFEPIVGLIALASEAHFLWHGLHPVIHCFRKQNLYQEVTVELVVECCCIEVAIGKVIAVLMDHPQAVRTVVMAARQIAVLVAISAVGI